MGKENIILVDQAEGTIDIDTKIDENADVAQALHEYFWEYREVSKSRFGFGRTLREFVLELRFRGIQSWVAVGISTQQLRKDRRYFMIRSTETGDETLVLEFEAAKPLVERLMKLTEEVWVQRILIS